MADFEDPRTDRVPQTTESTESGNSDVLSNEMLNPSNGTASHIPGAIPGFSFCRPQLQRSVLAPQRLNLFSSSNNMRSSSLPKPILRPSQLEASVPGSSSVPSTLSNPFAKVPVALHTSVQKSSSQPESGMEEVGVTAPRFVPLGTPAQEKEDSQTPSNTAGGVSTSVSSATSIASSFVFGQNLHERVTGESPVAEQVVGPSEGAALPEEGISIPVASTNGTSEMLFTSVINKDLPPTENSRENGVKSLSEAAREYEEARAVKRKYEEVAVITGEEGEINILQINCKLFIFDNSVSSWKEKGRGTLRLNDYQSPEGIQSHLVIRVSGTLRVLLNTKIWAGMKVDRHSPRSTMLTAQEANGEVKLFLVMASPPEMDQLYRCLSNRVATQQSRTENEPKSKIRVSDNDLNSSQEEQEAQASFASGRVSELESRHSHDIPDTPCNKSEEASVPTIVVQHDLESEVHEV